MLIHMRLAERVQDIVRDRTDLWSNVDVGSGRDVRRPRKHGLQLLLHYSSGIAKIFRTFQYGLQNGGTAGLIYGFIFAWIGAILQALVMAEMASMSASYPRFSPTGLILIQDSAGWRPFQLGRCSFALKIQEFFELPCWMAYSDRLAIHRSKHSLYMRHSDSRSFGSQLS